MVFVWIENSTTTTENSNSKDKISSHEKDGIRGELKKFSWGNLSQRVVENFNDDETKTHQMGIIVTLKKNKTRYSNKK